MSLLIQTQPLQQSEGGIYTIYYSNHLDPDFEDVDSVLYIGSTRSFKRRHTQHSRELEERHSNWLLKKIGRKAKRNAQELHFHKLLILPRLSLQPSQYDKVLRVVEQWFIHLNRPISDVETAINNGSDYHRHRLANWSDSIDFNETNSETLYILLSSYRDRLEDIVLKSIITQVMDYVDTYRWQ